MFCPICKAEYRQGFTRCADCDVELVHELPAAAIVPHAAAAPGDPEEDPFCSFWKGDDPRVHAELCELLDGIGIPYKTIRRQDHLFNINSSSAFELGIPFSLFEKAEAVVKEAYGGDEAIQPASRLLPVDSEHIPGTRFDSEVGESRARPFQRGAESGVDPVSAERADESSAPMKPEGTNQEGDGGDWGLEDAITKIWSGNEQEMAEFIAASLQINQIQTRHDRSGGKHTLYVRPEDEVSAREIVREVVEGVPPE